ncbi:MAG: zinc ribbon domain-containing protein [Ilumatobacteraceae bacterium]
MQCHSCGADVRDGQRFCMECGASLRGVADITGEVPVITAATPPPADTVDRTREMMAMAPPSPTAPPAPAPPPPPPPPSATATPAPADPATTPMVATPAPTASAAETASTTTPLPVTPPADPTPTPILTPAAARTDDTSRRQVVEATAATAVLTDDRPTGVQPTAVAASPEPVGAPTVEPRRRFRLRLSLILALMALAATVVAVATTMIEIVPPPDGPVPQYVVNDFGTNNTVAGLLAAGAMVLGALAWCFGYRWGAGLAGGAGAAVAGWAALLLGIAEWRIASAEAAVTPATITRDVGYWALVAAGGLGILVLLGSLIRSGRDGRAGLDPWIAALGAVSFLIAAGGPLIPQGTADWSGNINSDSLGVDLPTLFFVGRGVQLGLLALCGVIGFLSVRRYGLGLAVGAAIATGWLLATAATDQTTSPIGPGYENPGSLDLQPHAVTVVGFALVGFFSLVAIVMALLDADR